MKVDPKEIRKHARECQITRSKLPLGPWQTEPDRLTFKHRGMDCLMVRNPSFFNWCGYVGVPKSHPLYGKQFMDDPVSHLEAHGGVTFSDRCHGAICHKSKEPVWWLGFDCAHAYDLVPGMLHFGTHLGHIYRDVDYVKQEVVKLADQLKDPKMFPIPNAKEGRSGE